MGSEEVDKKLENVSRKMVLGQGPPWRARLEHAGR